MPPKNPKLKAEAQSAAPNTPRLPLCPAGVGHMLTTPRKPGSRDKNTAPTLFSQVRHHRLQVLNLMRPQRHIPAVRQARALQAQWGLGVASRVGSSRCAATSGGPGGSGHTPGRSANQGTATNGRPWGS